MVATAGSAAGFADLRRRVSAAAADTLAAAWWTTATSAAGTPRPTDFGRESANRSTIREYECRRDVCERVDGWGRHREPVRREVPDGYASMPGKNIRNLRTLDVADGFSDGAVSSVQQNWHSAIEQQRYFLRFVQEFAPMTWVDSGCLPEGDAADLSRAAGLEGRPESARIRVQTRQAVRRARTGCGRLLAATNSDADPLSAATGRP